MLLPMKVLNIQAGQSFAHVFCQHMLQKYDALALTDVTIWVPSSRIAATLKDTFLELGGDMLLPDIMPFNLGEEAEDELLFDGDADSKQEAISLIEKHLILSKQVLAKEPQRSVSACMKAAAELLKLHSRMLTWGVDIADIEQLVPDDLADHWQQNLLFLNIVFQFYPQWLTMENKVDPVDMRQRLLYETAKQLSKKQQDVWAVGFTDTTPAGMAMLKAVTIHPQGTLVLPGIDTHMQEETWQQLSQTHPQYSLKNLLEKLEIKRESIETLGVKEPSEEAFVWRNILAPHLVVLPETQLPNTTLVEAHNETEEAELIAHIMRESLNHEDKNCTLVTSEGALAMRVESYLRKWDISVDNSAGKPLTQTAIGELFVSVLNVISKRFSPLSVTTVLHHSDTFLEDKQAVSVLETAVLRGLKPLEGIAGLKAKLLQNDRLDDERRTQAESLLSWLEASWKPLLSGGKKPFDMWLKHHFEVLTAISQKEYWQQRDDGEGLLQFLSSWQQQGSVIGEISFNEYAQMVQQFLAQVTVRKRYGTHPRLFICGALEARLKKHDRVIIAGANEGVWPRKYTPDPWLNPAMEEKVGLPSVEMAVGLSSQDFVHLACSEEVFITRAIKQGGEETVPSRFLTRLVVALPSGYTQAVSRGENWLELIRESKKQKLEMLARETAVSHPPKTNRPGEWSASFTKDMMQCPYKAYISKILKLEKMDGYEELPSAADKGNLFHDCLEALFTGETKFSQPINTQTQEQALAHLLHISQQKFEQALKTSPATYAMWWPRFTKIAEDFIQQMAELDAQGRQPVFFEREGRVALNSGITLKARADRIDTTPEGAILVDYKTGQPPSVKDARYGMEPQIAVEAVIMEKGGYGSNLHCADAEFWQLKGSGDEGLIAKSALGKKDDDTKKWIDDSIEGVEKLTTHFAQDNVDYKAISSGSKFKPEKQCMYCDFAGICRFKEGGGV